MDNRNDRNTWPETEGNLPQQLFPQRRCPQRKRLNPCKRLMSLVLSAALFGGISAGAFYGVSQLFPQESDVVAAESLSSSGAVVTSLASTSYSTARYGMDVSDIAAAALPSVVAITNISVQEVQSYFNRFGPNGAGQTQLEETTSCGSGIIIANDGAYLYIVTNAHVVEDATTLSVSFVDNSVYEAQLCGADETVDLAVVKIALSALSSDTLSQISVIAVGDSDALEVGEQVVAIGNALGYGQSVTTGIVSALNRSLTNESGTTSTYKVAFDVLPAHNKAVIAHFLQIFRRKTFFPSEGNIAPLNNQILPVFDGCLDHLPSDGPQICLQRIVILRCQVGVSAPDEPHLQKVKGQIRKMVCFKKLLRQQGFTCVRSPCNQDNHILPSNKYTCLLYCNRFYYKYTDKSTYATLETRPLPRQSAPLRRMASGYPPKRKGRKESQEARKKQGVPPTQPGNSMV